MLLKSPLMLCCSLVLFFHSLFLCFIGLIWLIVIDLTHRVLLDVFNPSSSHLFVFAFLILLFLFRFYCFSVLAWPFHSSLFRLRFLFFLCFGIPFSCHYDFFFHLWIEAFFAFFSPSPSLNFGLPPFLSFLVTEIRPLLSEFLLCWCLIFSDHSLSERSDSPFWFSEIVPFNLLRPACAALEFSRSVFFHPAIPSSFVSDSVWLSVLLGSSLIRAYELRSDPCSRATIWFVLNSVS